MSADDTSKQSEQSVGAKLRAARIARKFTQSELARPDFSVSYISAIERGQIQPSLRALEILARRLNLSSSQLLPAQGQNAISNFISGSTSPIDGEAEIEWVLLETEVALRQGTTDRGKIDQIITQLSNLASKHLKRRQQILQRYFLGWAYFNTVQLHEAAGELFEASQLAEDVKDWYLRVQIHDLLGMVYAAMYNYQEAVQSDRHCLKLLKEDQPYDPLLKVQIYTHLGQYYLCLNNLDEAISMFQCAISILEEIPSLDHLQASYWKICEYYAQAKEYHLVVLYSYRLSTLQSQQAAHALKSHIYHYLSHAMLKRDQEQARKFLDEAVQQLSVTEDQLALASVTNHQAIWLFERGEPGEAAKQARKALDMARSFGDTVIAAEIELVLGRIDYAQSHYGRGDSHFLAGLEMLERLRMLNELAKASVDYAQLLEQQGKDHEALVHYRRAFEIRQKMGGSPR